MNALFIVPALVSGNVNERLIHPISKLVERNIILNNAGTFRQAMMLKASLLYRIPFISDAEIGDLEEYELVEAKEKDEKDDKPFSISSSITKSMRPAGIDMGRKRQDSHKGSLEDVEFPTDITFFNQITVEPTMLSIPVDRKFLLGGGGADTMTVGVKVIPYRAGNVKDIINLMKSTRGEKMLENWWNRKMRDIIRRIPFTPERASFKGEKGNSPVLDLLYTPSAKHLSKPRKLAQSIKAGGPSPWTTMLILSVNDFKEEDLKDNLREYGKLVKRGFGDMVVVNEVKESAYFCLQKWQACTEFPFAHMKQILNVSNVLDYQEISKWSRPFGGGTRSIGNVLRESEDKHFKPSQSDLLAGRINRLIND